MKPLITPLPGLIALRCLKAGETTTLALLGLGVVESGRHLIDGAHRDDDERISESYAALADDPAPAKTVRDYWEDQVAQHPWAQGHLDPFTHPLKRMSEANVAELRKAATFLSTISLSGAEHAANADLLGRVLTEMVALVNHRRTPGHAYTLNEATADLLLKLITGEMRLAEGMSLTDIWADSGMRAVALASLIRSLGGNAQTVKWRLWEADPMRRAILAVNAIAWELGDDIKISNGTEVKAAMLAAAQSGHGPRWWNEEIPEDIRSMVRDG